MDYMHVRVSLHKDMEIFVLLFIFLVFQRKAKTKLVFY